jgi:hypothetical protein
MTILFAGSACVRAGLQDEAARPDVTVEGARNIDGRAVSGLQRRWVVERTCVRMTRWRRLARDRETRIDVSAAMIPVASASLPVLFASWAPARGELP